MAEMRVLDVRDPAIASRFTLSTSRDNEPALRLYERAGYSAVDVVVAGGLVVRRLERETDSREPWPD